MTKGIVSREEASHITAWFPETSYIVPPFRENPSVEATIRRNTLTLEWPFLRACFSILGSLWRKPVGCYNWLQSQRPLTRPFVDLHFRKPEILTGSGEGNAGKLAEPDPFPERIGMHTDVFSGDFR